MITYALSKSEPTISGEINLQPSKPTNHRYIIIRVLRSNNLSQRLTTDTEDANILDKDLLKTGIRKNRGSSAKAIRHIRSFINYFGGEWILSTSKILKDNNSTQKIVKLLQQNGLTVRFEEREGKPPFRLTGRNFNGPIIRVEGSINSKIFEAKLLLNPSISLEQAHEFYNRIHEQGYIQITLRALQFLGLNTDWNIDETLIEREIIDGSELTIESDWLQASFWYSLVALSKKGKLTLHKVKPDSFQPEIAAKELFLQLGVSTQVFDDYVTIKKKGKLTNKFVQDLKHSPNLVFPLIATCVGNNVPFRLSGLQNISDKSEEILNNLAEELSRIGCNLKVFQEDNSLIAEFDGKSKLHKMKSVAFDTHSNCHIAMTLAALSVIGIDEKIGNPWVTNKIYPALWDELKNLGFKVETIQ
ncbi:MAG: hypothetical protein H6537_05175 [Bacteroidales bacterium]|nr:hypothetical protein [Bacteroidales bacterium]